MEVATFHESQRLEISAINTFGISATLLMENAANAAYHVISSRWGIEGHKILVACGAGNNGGDGLALARLLHARGACVSVLTVGDFRKLKGAAADNYRLVKNFSIEIISGENPAGESPFSRINFDHYHLLVDALIGVGLTRKIKGFLASLVVSMNQCSTPILALDLPSGVDANTGEILGKAIHADATVSFGILKRGNILYPGYALAGQLYYSKISFPREPHRDTAPITSINQPPSLPARDPHGHKGTFGKVLLIGGSSAYWGAPALAGLGALRGGAGYVQIACPAFLVPHIFPLIPEALFFPQDGKNVIETRNKPALLRRCSQADAVVLGPGISADREVNKLVRELIPAIEAPLIIDADALTALAGNPELTRERGNSTFLTPHPAEMARLLSLTTQEVESQRIEVSLQAAQDYQAYVVLKGAHSLIASPRGRVWINLTGNAGMGSAGTGDVLAGLIAALTTLKLGEEDVLQLAVFLHGLAGDIARENLGEESLIARSVLEKIPEAFQRYRQGNGGDFLCGKIIAL